MAAAETLIAMTAQGRSSAADDGIEHLAMLPCKMRSVVLPESVARCSDDVGHLKGGPAHRLISLLERFTSVGTRHLDGFQRAGNCLQMTPGQVQIDRGVGELGMSQQNLDRTQIGAGLQHVSSETVPERVRRHMLASYQLVARPQPRPSRQSSL